jgi:hypothetical protein
MDDELRQHLTDIPSARLRPANIVQAAKRDLRLRELKEQRVATAHEEYSFHNRHVHRARSVAHLVALALFEARRSSSKKEKPSMALIYGNPALLEATLVELLTNKEEAT